MVTSPAGLGTKNDCVGEDQQQLQTAGPFSYQRERLTSTNPQMSDSNENLVVRNPHGCLTPRQTGRLTVGRNITLNLKDSSVGREPPLRESLIPEVEE
jgi:hypothetical protein